MVTPEQVKCLRSLNLRDNVVRTALAGFLSAEFGTFEVVVHHALTRFVEGIESRRLEKAVAIHNAEQFRGVEIMFRCPFCELTSHHPKDKRERYCANCNVFVDDVLGAPDFVKRAMIRHCQRQADRHPEQAADWHHTARVWERSRYIGEMPMRVEREEQEETP